MSLKSQKCISREISQEFRKFISPENLATKAFFEIEGYYGWDHIDGIINGDQETTYIQLNDKVSTIQHIHIHSDAILYIMEGSGYVLSKDISEYVCQGDIIEIKRKTPHGFFISTGHTLSFISVQNPSILQTDGTRDFIVLKNTEMTEEKRNLLQNNL